MKAVESMTEAHHDGMFTGGTDVVERIRGQWPRSLADFVRANDRKFR